MGGGGQVGVRWGGGVSGQVSGPPDNGDNATGDDEALDFTIRVVWIRGGGLQSGVPGGSHDDTTTSMTPQQGRLSSRSA